MWSTSPPIDSRPAPPACTLRQADRLVQRAHDAVPTAGTPTTEERDVPELARKITIDRTSSTVSVDGAEFPWHIGEQGPSVEGTGSEMVVVHVPVLCSDLEIIPET